MAEGKLGARAMASSPRSPAPRRGTADDSISPVRTVKIGALTSSQARNALLLRGAAPSDELTRDELIGQLKTLLPEGTTAVEVRSRTSRFSGADSPAPLSPASPSETAPPPPIADVQPVSAEPPPRPPPPGAGTLPLRLVAIGIVLIAIAVYLR